MSDDSGINAAILNLCARAQGDGAAAPASAPPPRETSDYEWLRQALASVESPEKKLKKSLDLIANYRMANYAPASPPASAASAAAAPAGRPPLAPTNAPPSAGESVDVLLDTLTELGDMVEDINWAAEFSLMGGPKIVLDFVASLNAAEQEADAARLGSRGRSDAPTAGSSEASQAPAAAAHSSTPEPTTLSVKTLLCTVIAHASQLNDTLQSDFLKLDWPKFLLQAIRIELERPIHSTGAKSHSSDRDAATASTAVLASALHACSCLCRSSAPNTLSFLRAGGMEGLIAVLRVPHGRRCSYQTSKVLARVSFFASYLAESGISADELIDLLCVHLELPVEGEDAVEEGAPSAGAGGGTTNSPAYETTYAGSTDDDAAAAAPRLNEAGQRAAATALVALAAKSPSVVKEKVGRRMPRRLGAWRGHLDRDDEDPRCQLLAAVDKSG